MERGMFVHFYTRELLLEMKYLENTIARIKQSAIIRRNINDLQYCEQCEWHIHEIEDELMIRM